MQRYRAAVIGLGRMGSTFDDEIEVSRTFHLPYCHGPSYFHSPHTDLAAGADPHDEQRALFGDRWGVSQEHLYSDYREMLERERPDVVSVATTAKIRAAVVLDAVRAGVKAIWAEKPIAFSLAEADAMVDACRENGVAFAINTPRRWIPSYVGARKILDSGELGRVLQVVANFPCGLSHNGSHVLDAVRFLAGGDVEWVFGEMESDEAAQGDEDLSGACYLAYDNGVRAFVRTTDCGAVASKEIDVICERGRITCREGTGEYVVYRQETTPGAQRAGEASVRYPVPVPARVQGTGLAVIEDLVVSMETGGQPRASAEDGRASLETAIALRESHRRGGVRVRLPIEDRSLAIRSAETLRGDQPARIRRMMEAGRA